MTLAEWFIKNNRTSTLIFLLLACAGIFTFNNISRLEDPDIVIRTAVVATSFPGASPQKVEELVTDKLEKKIREMSEVERVTSQSLAGLSIVYVDAYEKYKNMKPIWDRLRNKVNDVKGYLPEGVEEPIVNDEFGDVFGVVVALTSDGYTYREMKDVADDVRDELLKVNNVAKVDLYGLQQEQIFVEFSNARLAEYGVNPNLIAEVLSTQNILQSGGNARVDTERIIIEATGEYKSLDDLKRTSLRIPGRSESIYLEDVATIRRDFVDPPTTLCHFNGESAIVLAVSMAEGGNVVEMGDAVTARLKELEVDLPIGLDFDMVSYQPKFVSRSINDFMVNLGEAFVFVVAVMLLFAGLRLGLVVGALVPMACLMSITLMPFFDVDLQRVSIASLIIALGMLVDNGVVVSENILVRLNSGEDRLKACGGAVKELTRPLLSASLTTIFAFLPIPLAQSGVGEYCISLFIVVSSTLLCSWLLSITFVPMLCYYLLKPKVEKQSFDSSFYTRYRNFLLLSLRNRKVFLSCVVGIVFLGVMVFKLIPTIFFPPNDREMFVIDFWQPYGTDIRRTEERVSQLEEFLVKQEGIDSVGSFVGSGGPRWYLSLSPEQDNPNYAFVIINTATYEAVAGLMAKTRAYLDANFPDTRHTVKQLESGTPVGTPIQIRISGKDMDDLYEARNLIAQTISKVPGVYNIHDDWGEWAKKLLVNVNQEQAKRAGMTSQDIALSLKTQFSGAQATEFREGDEVIPILVRSQEAFREDLGKIEGMNVYSYSDRSSVPLLNVAKTELVWQPSNIQRRDQTRTMTLKADVLGRFPSEALAEVMPKVQSLVDSDAWPKGFWIEYGGEQEESAKAQASVAAGMPLALGLLSFILVSQFNSIRRPVIILLTIPPMLLGIALGLLITNCTFGFMAMLGMISLMGIIVNNAIMLIDRIEIERAEGATIQNAIVLSAQKRFRPILMTTITTIVGLIPLSLQGGELWRPMANVLIFGLGFATVLTLVLCPVLYSLFFKASFKQFQWDPKVLDASKQD